MKVAATGIGWYAEEDWTALKALFTDAHKLHRNYADWLNAAETGFRQLSNQGHVVVKVPIRPGEFGEWCRLHQMEPNAAARSEFASRKVHESVD